MNILRILWNHIFPSMVCRHAMIDSHMMTSSNGNIFRDTGPLCGEFTGHRSFDVFFDLHLNRRLSKQSWGWWFETPSCPLWRHRNEVLNYANPLYDVATICHQVRWLRWGHPSIFHTATSLLIWHEMFCVRDISYRLTWMEFIKMFSAYAQSGTHSRFNW